MSQAQRESVEAMLRELALGAGASLAVQRPLLEELVRQATVESTGWDLTSNTGATSRGGSRPVVEPELSFASNLGHRGGRNGRDPRQPAGPRR